MRKSATIAITLGGFCVTGALFSSVALADTTAQPTAATATNTQLQTDGATFKQLQAQNKQLDEQIKAAYQAWAAQHPNPMKQLTADAQASLKNLRAEVQSERATLKPVRVQVTSLRKQLKSAKRAHDTASEASLKSQLQPLTAQLKAGHQEVQADRQQIAALLPSAAESSFRTSQATLHSALKADVTALKGLRKQLRTDEHAWKVDRKANNTANLDPDVQKVNADLTSVIAAKQQLLKDFPDGVTGTTAPANNA